MVSRNWQLGEALWVPDQVRDLLSKQWERHILAPWASLTISSRLGKALSRTKGYSQLVYSQLVYSQLVYSQLVYSQLIWSPLVYSQQAMDLKCYRRSTNLSLEEEIEIISRENANLCLNAV